MNDLNKIFLKAVEDVDGQEGLDAIQTMDRDCMNCGRTFKTTIKQNYEICAKCR